MTDAASAQLPVTANFINPETMHHPAGYTHVVEVTAGRPVYIAGQVALDRTGALVGPGDIRAQARQVFDNLQAALEAVGAGFEQVVKLTYYLVDATQLPVVREVRDQYVNTQQPPASTAVEVRRLVRDDLLIEVEAVAVVVSFQPMTTTARRQTGADGRYLGGRVGHTAGMATGQEPIRVGSQPPFAVPPERRDPARRLRGRLLAPVTVWTAGRPPGGAGLTVSSVLVAEGQPARLLGLIDPTSAFWETARETGAFVVHVLAVGDRALAERFSEVRPPIRGPFERLQVATSPWGPVLGGSRPRAGCRLAGSEPVGYAELVEGVIEQLELPDLEDPLAYLHGSYRSVGDLPDHG